MVEPQKGNRRYENIVSEDKGMLKKYTFPIRENDYVTVVYGNDDELIRLEYHDKLNKFEDKQRIDAVKKRFDDKSFFLLQGCYVYKGGE